MKKILSLFLCAMVANIAFYSAAEAQGRAPLRHIKADEIQKMTDDHTFWQLGKLDRIHFKPDNKMVQQINDGWRDLAPGTLFHGTWSIENDTLCWAYTQETAQAYNLSTTTICFDVYTREPRTTFMTTHVEDTHLKPVGSGVNGPTIFRLNQWHSSDYVIDPEWADDVVKGVALMKDYRVLYGGKIPEGTIKREEMNERMQEYYDEMVDKIFFVVNDYMFFDDTGYYYWVQAEDIVRANGDLDKMMEEVQIGRWSVKDNIKCFYVNENTRSCEFILPRGKGLTREHDLILGFHHSTFSRLHGEGAVGHMEPEDTESPELFAKLQAMHANK